MSNQQRIVDLIFQAAHAGYGAVGFRRTLRNEGFSDLEITAAATQIVEQYADLADPESEAWIAREIAEQVLQQPPAVVALAEPPNPNPENLPLLQNRQPGELGIYFDADTGTVIAVDPPAPTIVDPKSPADFWGAQGNAGDLINQEIELNRVPNSANLPLLRDRRPDQFGIFYDDLSNTVIAIDPPAPDAPEWHPDVAPQAYTQIDLLLRSMASDGWTPSAALQMLRGRGFTDLEIRGGANSIAGLRFLLDPGPVENAAAALARAVLDLIDGGQYPLLPPEVPPVVMPTIIVRETRVFPWVLALGAVWLLTR